MVKRGTRSWSFPLMPGRASRGAPVAKTQRAAQPPALPAVTAQPATSKPDPELQSFLASAPGEPGHEHEARLFEHFFSWPPPHADTDLSDISFERARMSRESRRAMWASLFMLSVSLLGIGAYAAYHRLVMPVPVELGADTELVLPTPPGGRGDLPLGAAVGASEAAEGSAALSTGGAREQAVNAAVDPALVAAVTPEPGKEPQPAAKAVIDPAAVPVVPQESPSVARESPDAPVEQNDEGEPRGFAAWLERARQRAGAGDDTAALSAFDQALAVRPFAPEALAGKAAALLRLHDDEGANATAEQAVALAPSSAEGLWVLAQSMVQLGNEAAAKATLERCVERASGSYVARCQRGLQRSGGPRTPPGADTN